MNPLEEMGKFKTVVVDPPWDVRQGNCRNNGGLPYSTMLPVEIAALPIQTVVESNCNVFLWTIQRHLRDSFDVLDAWRLDYRFTMVWHKDGGSQFYDGPCSNAEFIVVGGKGLAQWQEISGFSLAFHAARGGHSEKPEGFYDLLRRVTLGPRLDVFGRRRIAGFESWGNEAPDGPALPDHYQQVLLV